MKCNCGKGGKCDCGGMPKKKMAYGGMVNKPMKMNKGGLCGASMPAARPMKKSK